MKDFALRRDGMRRLIRIAAAVGVTLAMSAGLSACGGGGAQQPAAPGGGAPAKEAPARQTKPAETAGEVTFGYAVSRTGRFSSEGVHTEQGYLMWADAVNARGGLNIGGKRYKVKLVGLDTQSDTNNAVKLYERLIKQDKVDFVLSPWGSGDNFAVSVVTEREGYPLLMASASSNTIFERGFKNIFQTSVAASQLVKPLADYLIINQDIKTIAIAYENFLFTQQKHDYFLKEIEGSRLRVVADEQYPLVNKEFSSLIGKVKAKNPDAFIVFNIMPSSIYLTNQMTELGFKPKLYFASISIMFEDFHKAVGPAANGILETGFTHPDINDQSRKFWSDYEKRFNTPGNTDAAHAYIGAQILGQAIEKAGTLDRAEVTKTIRGGTWETIGGTFQYDERGMNTKLPMFLAQWVNGRRAIVWPKSMATAELVYPRPY